MTNAERIGAALSHREPDSIPVDFGASAVTGIHVSCVAALRRYYGLEEGPVKVIDPGQMLGEIADDLKRAMGVGVEGVTRLMSRFGFPLEDWKPWRLYDGLEVLVPGQFNVTVDANAIRCSILRATCPPRRARGCPTAAASSTTSSGRSPSTRSG